MRKGTIKRGETLLQPPLPESPTSPNFLARGIPRNEEPEGIQKLTEPCVVAIGYRNLKMLEKLQQVASKMSLMSRCDC